nr:MAG TPA: hypothetical protein [Caudoviricetes sp.]
MHPLFLHYPITLCHSFFYIIFIFILLYTLRFVPYKQKIHKKVFLKISFLIAMHPLN